MPIASNDPQAMQIAAGLVSDAGCDPVETGNLASAMAFQQGGSGWRTSYCSPIASSSESA